MIRLLFILISIALLQPYSSGAKSPMVFKREVLAIIPKERIDAPETKPASDEAQEPEKAENAPETPPQRDIIRFYSEFRPESVLSGDFILSLSRISERHTMTVIFDPPRYDLLEPLAFSHPLDVLLVNPEGTIVQIMPDLVMSQIPEFIESDELIRARVILKGGAVELLDIRPGDRVEHAAFRPAPRVLK